MKVTYTGRQVELAPAQLRKIEAQAAKLSKFLDGREEREAHLILGMERGRHRAEITVNYFDHPLVGAASSPDVFTAVHGAVEKLEKQAIKVKAKRRDNKRTPRQQAAEPAVSEAPPANGAGRVYRIDGAGGRKPMTLDEAVLEMEDDRHYLVYNDALSGRVAVLLRRRDGHFDLIEC
jgi:putative sigma-54 modulation protein